MVENLQRVPLVYQKYQRLNPTGTIQNRPFAGVLKRILET